MNKNYFVIGLVVFAVLISGCGSNKAPAATQITLLPAQSNAGSSTDQLGAQNAGTAYPNPELVTTSGQVIVSGDKAVEQLVIPTPSAGKSVLTGQLELSAAASDYTMTGLYLTPVSAGGGQPEVKFSVETSLVAAQEIGTGRFAFADVPPGEYALVVWTSMNAYPIQDSTGNTMFLTLTAGEVKDLGKVPLK